jgi:hypothetical protein
MDAQALIATRPASFNYVNYNYDDGAGLHSTDSGADAERAGENELRQVNAYPWERKRP